ncbi:MULTISPECIES: SIR2 family protein [unclassified Fusobacterium]|uniref:SIR2 family protein n=1 Tax=unclassified Fusobacterium TaxID=2648384 RepID=UPI0026381581|nr:SIR2 family protein [Fusobacterium sp.]
MKNFFEKFEKDQKFNLFTGDFLNKLTGYPSKADISEAILSELQQSTKRYIKDMNSFSDIVQAYLDAVIDTKKNLVKQIKENFEHRYSVNIDIYSNIINSGLFENIFTNNFDNIIETNFCDSITKITPTNIQKRKENTIGYYKFLGDMSSVSTFFISSQDIRKLKTLEFYSEFFKRVREEIKSRPTIFLGIDLEDSDMMNMLSFILEPLKEFQPIYMITNTSIISSKSADLIGKYNIKLITSSTKDFLDYFSEISQKEERILPEKKFVW